MLKSYVWGQGGLQHPLDAWATLHTWSSPLGVLVVEIIMAVTVILHRDKFKSDMNDFDPYFFNS